MANVALMIPTMNRPDFILRHFRFYELTDSPHPIYLSDSSNEENAQKIKDIIKQFKKLDITYQWAAPGRDHLDQLLPLIKEKYCIHVGDDDLIIPKTMSECADFLENNPDYATCSGRQVNFRLDKQNYNKPYGIIASQSGLLGRSIEDEDMLVRIKNFWADTVFMNFSVRRIETEKIMRNVTKHYSLTEHMLDFLLASILTIAGKHKALDGLCYMMQVSGIRYSFEHDLTIDVISAPDFNEKWNIYEKGFSEVIRKFGNWSEEDGVKIVKWIFALYLAQQFAAETSYLPVDNQAAPVKKQTHKRYIKKAVSLIKKVVYNRERSENVASPRSKYFNDFKFVKDFLSKNA